MTEHIFNQYLSRKDTDLTAGQLGNKIPLNLKNQELPIVTYSAILATLQITS